MKPGRGNSKLGTFIRLDGDGRGRSPLYQINSSSPLSQNAYLAPGTTAHPPKHTRHSFRRQRFGVFRDVTKLKSGRDCVEGWKLGWAEEEVEGEQG